MNSESQLAPHRRDPAARRQAIIDAAAAITVEQGAAALTHRAVAKRAGVALGSTTQYFTSIDDLREHAVQQLADEIDRDLAEIAHALAADWDIVEHGTAIFAQFLNDEQSTRASAAMMAAALSDPHLRELSFRWTDRLTALLTDHIGAERAQALVHYIDGVTMHAALLGTHVPQDTIKNVVQSIVSMPVTTKSPTS